MNERSPVEISCASCGTVSPAGFRFCGNCGARLTATAGSGREGLAQNPAALSERRQVTVMFCDLVGSTQLSEQMEPEDLRELILDYRDVCAASVARYDGSVARYLGDGILVYFGYPKAHEDDPRRAILAALDIRLGMQRLNDTFVARDWPPLELRIGIHTGLVIAGDMGTAMTHEPMAVVGSAPNVAARLQAQAAPNAIVISTATHDIVEGFFEFRALGARVLAGIAEPVALYEVLNETGARDRLGARPHRSMLLGRTRELELLRDRWARAGHGAGQFVLLEGPAGIGKSRLLMALQEEAGIGPDALLRCHCSEYYETTAFHPIAELVDHVASGGSPLAQHLDPGLPALLDPALAEAPSDPAMDPEQRRQKLMDGLVGWLSAASRERPVLFVAEDLHWADDSTRSFLRLLGESLSGSQLMVVATTRPGGGSSVADLPGLLHLPLHVLSLDQARDLVVRTAGKPLPDDVVGLILARADGIPLFVEELTRAVVASPLLIERNDRFEVGAAGAPAIPMTLRDSLMARLDALGGSKQVAQIASVLGRSFPELLVRLVADLQQALLEEHLRTLVGSQFFCREDEPELPSYAFTHALLQDAAYDSLVRQTRQLYHRRTAMALEQAFPETTRQQPEILARHHALAGDAAKAADLWEAAGRRSAARSANVEAAAQIANALSALAELPDSPDRQRQELRLQIALGGQMIITAGNADPRVERAFARALLLSEVLAEPGMLFQARRGLLSYYQVRGRPRVARRFGEEMLQQAEDLGDVNLLIQAHRALGLCRFFIGELSDAADHLSRALDMCRTNGAGGETVVFISDPAVLAQCNLGWAECALGRPDSGLAHCEQAVARARLVRHQHSLAYALSIAAAVRQMRREPKQVRLIAEEILSLAGRGGYTYWRGWAQGLQGWALAMLGNPRGGLEALDTALTEYAATGAEIMRPYFLALKAEVLNRCGAANEAVTALTAAEADIQTHGMAFCHGDVVRRRAVLAAGSGDTATAEALFARARAIADEQAAGLLRLRIAIDRAQAFGGEALADLQALYASLAEGHETADAVEAATLLNHL